MTDANGKLHVVGGGVGQVTLVQKAKALGLRVLVTDMYDNPPCRALADEFEQINTTDRLQTLAASQRHDCNAIATDQTDVAVPTVAYVAQQRGWPGIGVDTALRFTNKRIMREALRELCPDNIPGFRYFTNRDESIAYVRAAKRKLVVKPTDAQGSRGVCVVEPGDDATWHVTQAFNGGFGDGILVEEFAGGNEVAVESVAIAGKPYLLAISSKDHYPENDAIDMRVNFPSALSDAMAQKLWELARRVVTGLGLRNGLSHAEFKVDGEQITVIEIAARGAGSGVSSHIVPFLTGFDTTGAVIDFAFGRAPATTIGNYLEKAAVLEFLAVAPGRVQDILVPEWIQNATLSMNLLCSRGDVIASVRDARNRPGYFIVGGLSLAQVRKISDQVRNSIVITVDQSNG
jgi:carbamoyl-phosphate synthase large subunit